MRGNQIEGRGVIIHATIIALLTVACWNDTSRKTSEATPTRASSSPSFHLTLGDATVYELVDRYRKPRAKPTRYLVVRAGGTVDLINTRTDRPWVTFVVKDDGTVLDRGKPIAAISEHAIIELPHDKRMPLTIEGDTISLEIKGEVVKVSLAKGGNVTVIDRPDGNKWRIDAQSPAVLRTAFLVLALAMKDELDPQPAN
jgi:hypothetical protein